MKMEMILGENVKISPKARINVSEYLEIGDRSNIRDFVLIEGRHIEIGKEAWIDEYAHIGGGSCSDYQSFFKAGDFLHMGKYSHVNPARKLTVGNEVGIGINTKIFTHGSYLSAYDGFPVKFAPIEIKNRVWLPNAWVNPGVKIGNDVVVAAFSLVNRDLPDGCLAGGVPAHILKKGAYPRELTDEEKREIIKTIENDAQVPLKFNDEKIHVKSTIFDLKNRTVEGNGNRETEIIKNQLRRYGIRFKYCLKNGRYHSW